MTGVLAFLLHAAIVGIVRGDDMAFISVGMEGELDIRFLDVDIASKAGIAGFFQESPMLPHDWLDTTALARTIDGVVKAANDSSSDVAKEVSRVEGDLAVLFQTLPKLEGSGGLALDDGPARYAIHRYFRRTHGWSLKGLEPASTSLLLQDISLSNPDTKQVTRYAVIPLLFNAVRDAGNTKGLKLTHLAIIIVIIDRLALVDIQDTLFLVFRTLQLPIAGEKTKEELTLIIETFLLTYVFGTNLEISTSRAVEDARRFLADGHPSWPKIRSFVEDLVQESATPVTNFKGLLRLLSEDFARRGYPKLLSRDCKIAKSSLAAAPELKQGRLPLSALPKPEEDIRPLFSEVHEDMRALGLLEDSADGYEPIEGEGPRLLVANYVLSQAMCLATSSEHAVCCHNECEDIMERIEGRIRAPSAKPEEVIAALLEASPALRARDDVDVEVLRQRASDPSDGLVRLHGRPLASWLHTLLPLECPAPTSEAQIGPKTPDEWMQEPSMNEMNLVTIEDQLDRVLVAFTTMGKQDGQPDEKTTDRLLEEFPVTVTYPDMAGVTESELFGGEDRISILQPVLRLTCMGAVLWVAVSTLRTGLASMRESACGSQDLKIAQEPFA